jgi:hypothetical protein
MSQRFQMININSMHRNSGDINNFKIILNHDNFKTNHFTDKITISPITCIIPKTWYQVNQYNDSFTISVDGIHHIIKIAHGNYNVMTLLNEIEPLFLKVVPEGLIGYDQFRNKYLFSSFNDNKIYKLIFTNYSCFLLGFELNDIIDFTFVSTEHYGVLSKNPLIMNVEFSIKVHSDLPFINNNCIDNNNTINDFIATTTVLSFPIKVGPFENMIFEANNHENIIHTLSHSNIDSIHFWLTDNLNRPLLITHDWCILLKVTYTSQEDKLEVINNKISQIEESLRFMILDKKTRKKHTNKK